MGTSLNGLTPAGTYPGLIKTGDNAPIDGTLKTLSDGNGNNLPMEASTTAVNFTGTLTQAGATLQPTLVSGTNIKTINGTSLLGSGNIPVVTSPSGVAGAIQFSNGSAFASDAANLFWDDTNNRLGVGTNAPTAILQAENSTNGVLLARFKDALASTSYIDIKNDVTLTDYTGLYFGTSRKIMSKQGGSLFISCDNNISFVNGLQSVGAITPTEFQIGSITGARLGIKGSGSTSATTSLLVQNSAGTETFRVRDDGRVLIPLPAGQVCLVDNLGGYNTDTIGIGGRLNINGLYSAINASAVLQANSTTQGFLPPRMTTTQRDAIATPATGLKVYNTTTNTTDTYDGTTWQRFGQQTLIKGSGSTSATTSLLVQNSAGTAALTITDDRNATFGNIVNANSFRFGSVSELGGNCRVTTTNPANPQERLFSAEGSPSQTVAPTTSFHDIRNFTPTSGSALFTSFQYSGTINQTGGANGITRGFYINPTLTAAADFRAIETTAGKIIFGGLPTSSAGLVSGQIWNDAGTIKIV